MLPTLTLACGMGSPLFFIISMGCAILGPLLLTALVVYPFVRAIKALGKTALVGRPLAFFLLAFIGGAFFCFGLNYTAIAMANEFSSTSSSPMILFVVVPVILGITILFQFCFHLTDRKPTSPPNTPRFQVWIQDLLIAMICYGAGLTLSNKLAVIYDSTELQFFGSASYLLFAGTIGLFIATDICRLAEQGKTPYKRALIFIAVFTLFPLTLPGALFAWWRWRRALTSSPHHFKFPNQRHQ